MTRPNAAQHRVLAVAVIGISAMLAACAAGSAGGPTGPSGSASATATPTTAESIVESAGPSATSEASASIAPEPTESLGEFACGAAASGVGSAARAQITDVRVGAHDTYDRIVFEFEGGIPAYGIEVVEPPFSGDPSGLPLDVAGNAFLRITFDGGTRMMPDGSASYAGPTSFEPGFDELVQLIEGGDFEAVSTWYAGLSTDPCIRVLALTDPARLVIDIEH